MRHHCLGSCASVCPHNGDKVERYAKKVQAPAKFTNTNNNNNDDDDDDCDDDDDDCFVVFVRNLLKQKIKSA